MSDSRRRRQIKTPAGPRKKDAPDLSKYQMSPPPMGRQEVPKPQPKPDPSQQQRSGGLLGHSAEHHQIRAAGAAAVSHRRHSITVMTSIGVRFGARRAHITVLNSDKMPSIS